MIYIYIYMGAINSQFSGLIGTHWLSHSYKHQTLQTVASTRPLKSLPRDFHKYQIFKWFCHSVKNYKNGVAGWIDDAQNRNRLADELTGVMDPDVLQELRANSEKTKQLWARKLRNQRANVQRKRSREPPGQPPRQRSRSGPSIPSMVHRHVAQLRSLDAKQPHGPAAIKEYRRLCWCLAKDAVALVAKVPSDSLVWVLKGEVFDSGIINAVSTNIRKHKNIYVRTVDIIWSNFLVSHGELFTRVTYG